MNREIKFPYWANNEKTQIVCQFHYEDGTVLEASVMDTEEGNPDWAEIIETFGVEGIDEVTNKMLQEKEEAQKAREEQDKDKIERIKNEALFASKLEAFEIDLIKNSKNRDLKSKIRKAKSLIEVQAYTTILMQKEMGDAE